MRRTVAGLTLATIVFIGTAGCSGSDQAADAGRNAADQAASAAQSAGAQASGAAGATTEQVQQQIDDLLQANPVVFAPQGAELTSESQQTLQQMAAALTASGAKVTVETHAGYDDPQQYWPRKIHCARKLAGGTQDGQVLFAACRVVAGPSRLRVWAPSRCLLPLESGYTIPKMAPVR